MLTRLLVPLDGSPLAEGALPYAQLLATALPAEVELLRVVDAQGSDLARLLPGLVAQSAQTAALREAGRYLAQVAKGLKDLPKVSTKATVGLPVVELITAADDQPGTLTVMATHGRSGVRRWLLGSVAQHVLHYGARPLLLVRPQPDAPKAPALQTVLVPLDGSTAAEQALAEAGPLAQRLETSLLLLRVTPDIAEYARWSSGEVAPLDYGAIVAAAAQDATQYLEALRARLRGELRCPVHTRHLQGDPAQSILDQAAGGATLIAMSTHGRTGLRRALLGSVADRVVRHGTAPVLLLRQPPES